MISPKINRKIAIRNPHAAMDSHDLWKTQLMRMLVRLNPDTQNTEISSEASEDGSTNYPDIRVKHWKSRRAETAMVGFELQRTVTDKWREEKKELYQGADWIEVDLKKVEANFKEKTGIKFEEVVRAMRECLEPYAGKYE